MAVICFYSCSKTGLAGPQGEQGSPGPKGDPGAQGIPGADGSTIYSGNGAPSADLGKEGNYYLDKSSSGLYGPKTDKGWGNPLDLKGEKGDKGDPGKNGKAGKDGQAGSQILSGDSKPASSIGNTGDYYWDVSTYTLYGPKTAAGWGSGMMLRGPKGDKGDKGDPGNANVISSGWLSIPEDAWVETQTGILGLNSDALFFWQPGDIDMLVALHDPYKIYSENTTGAILVYVDLNNRSILAAPFDYEVPMISRSKPLFYSHVRFRFVIQKSGLDYLLYPVVTLREDTWDTSSMKGLLNDIKWKIVVIPANANARKSSPPPNPKDYKATCAYYGISE